MGKTVGLDLGIGSLGWAVVEDDFSVLEAGSNIFPAGDAESNIKRRGFRQGRRLKRREHTRLMDFDKLWENYGLRIPENKIHNVLELRVRALTEKVEQDEVYAILHYMLKHRGISYLEDALDESTKGKSDYERGLKINQKQLEDKLPCQIQMDRLNRYGNYRGTVETVDENGEKTALINTFTIGAYRKEIEAIFEEQVKYHSFISDEFENDYLGIFNRKREYYEGPGNEKSRTDYGRYTTRKDAEGNYITEENIFEKLIGKCSVYKDELRGSGASYTAQEFNILNDLNNLTINGRKLEEVEKRNIIKAVKSAKAVDMRKIIAKEIGEDIESLSGARIDKDDKEIFHTFEIYNKMRRGMEKVGLDINRFTTEELDKIGDILTLNTEKKSIEKALVDQENGIDWLDEEMVAFLVDFRKKNGALFTKWQSLSLKIMRELIPDLYETTDNQMQLLSKMGVFKGREEVFKEYNKIPESLITEEIYNPVVRRSVSIAIKVLNALIKKYGSFDQVVIEMPRDRNSEEEKKRIKDDQKKNEKELSGILKKINDEYGIVISDGDFRNHKQLRMKLKLWNEQGGICLYSGKSIDIDDLIHEPSKFEIDHIIPRSISFDDSRANKVLVYGIENQKKGNQTPKEYLSSVNRDWDFDEFMSYVLSQKNKKDPITKVPFFSKRKVENLLFSESLTKYEVIKGFVNRNINDTRYASRELLNCLQSYFRAHGAQTKIKVIRGSFTHQMRNCFKLEKNREESYNHHAVDAMLIAYSQMGYDSYREYMSRYFDYENEFVKDTEELAREIDDEKMKNIMYFEKHNQMSAALKKGQSKVKYWHRVDKKINRSLCIQTIRGTREYDNKIYKINRINIYSKEGIKVLRNLISNKKTDRILMSRNDSRTFEDLIEIYNEYDGENNNPFIEYEKATGDYLRKYSKKHNGPRIVNIRYIDGVVGTCIDISHRYGFEKDSKKVILEKLAPYCTDVYYSQKENKYYLIGYKYADVKCQNGTYILNPENVKQLMIKEKMITDDQSPDELGQLGINYCFRLFENDIIEYKKGDEVYRERFLSRTKPNSIGYIETKPIDKASFEKGQNQFGIGNAEYIKKINTDILGNAYYQD